MGSSLTGAASALTVPAVALAASTGLNACLAWFGRRLNWCDPAGLPLKTHARPVPLTGGIGLLVVVALVAAWVGRGAAPFAAAAAIGLVPGLLDDLFWKERTAPLRKLAAQAAAAAGVWAVLWTSTFDIRYSIFGGGRAWPLAAALTVLFVLGAMNAFNLEDGMDGLCAGEAAVSALALAHVLRSCGADGPALLALCLAAALAGFLVLNWHPAFVFLGDGGSHLLGALLAALALTAGGSAAGGLAAGGAGLRGLAGAVLLLGLPVVDAAFTVLRRLWTRSRLLAGDRRHLYDYAHHRGLPVWGTVVLMWLLHTLLCAAGTALLLWRNRG